MSDDTKPIGNSDWIKDLDLVDRVSCDNTDCTREGALYFRIRCCGTVLVSCRLCVLELVQTLNIKIRSNSPVACEFCGAVSNPRGWITMPKTLEDDEETSP